MVQASSVVGFGVFGLVVVSERVEDEELVVEVEFLGGRCSAPVVGAVPGPRGGAGWCCAVLLWRAGCW